MFKFCILSILCQTDFVCDFVTLKMNCMCNFNIVNIILYLLGAKKVRLECGLSFVTSWIWSCYSHTSLQLFFFYIANANINLFCTI